MIYCKALAPELWRLRSLTILSSASWTPKKADGIIRRAENWRADGVDSSLDLKA